VNIAAEIDSGYKLLLEKDNKQVKTKILSEIINHFKFCGKCEQLPLRRHDESTSSKMEVALALLAVTWLQ